MDKIFVLTESGLFWSFDNYEQRVLQKEDY